MKLSANLSLAEVVKSNTALRLGIKNSPSEKVKEKLKIIAREVFQPLREACNLPIFISSGYRSPTLNRAIGGSEKSQHCKGEALDIDMDNKNSPLTNRFIFQQIKDSLRFDQLIWEYGNDDNPAWVHVSYREGNNRGEILQAVRRKGRTVYVPWA